MLPKQDHIKPDIILSYFSTLKSYHIARRVSLKDFHLPWMTLIILGRRKLFPSKKQNRFLITKNILKKIMEKEPLLHISLNIDKVFKIGWENLLG